VAREVARGREPSAPRGGSAHGPARLGLEGGERVLDGLVVDALNAEVVAYEGISPTSLREQLGARERKPLVVEEAGTPENREGVGPLPRDEAAATQALIQSPFRQRTCAQGPRGDRKSAVPPELAAKQSENRSLELHSAREPRAYDDFLRKRSPALAVHLDRDAPRPGRTQAGDDVHYFLAATSSSTGGCSTSEAFGSRRAEAT
jgi:hypothetical protein